MPLPIQTLLTRDDFREKVFERDAYRCVVCHNTAADSHHILDRSLWDNGGYYLSNGVALCPKHHVEAEKTLISCEELRKAAGIIEIIKPDHFYTEDAYDHWGNIVLPSGMRIKGELFGNENVQKILKDAGVLKNFLTYIKYPRTYHTPWSENLQNDDRKHEDINFLLNKQIVASVKLDGENSSLYSDYIHARSINSSHHESRSWLKALHGQIAHDIPEGWRICGENMYAKHSIYYQHLKSYFYVFSIWNENNIALSWNETCEYTSLLGLQVVPVLCRGIYSSIEELRNAIDENIKEYSKEGKDEIEGYVIRLAGPITYKDFRISTAKAVRKHHVTTSTHWMSEKIIPNKIEV